jgi:hypothetical protein
MRFIVDFGLRQVVMPAGRDAPTLWYHRNPPTEAFANPGSASERASLSLSANH